MRQLRRLLLLLFFVCILLIIEHAVTTLQKQPAVTVPVPVQPTSTVLGNTTSLCHTDGILPDPNCTPGAIDPTITQENIHQTICVKDYTKTVRPPVSYTNKLKLQQIQEYGYIDTNPKNYEEDHLISLSLGGSPSDPKNLWPEPDAAPNPKDRIENMCHKKICNGELSLAEVQKQIATNWPTACQ